VNGGIQAERASGGEVEVVATKRAGQRGSAADVRVEVVPHQGGVTICAVYPAPPGQRANRCTAGGGDTRVHQNDTRVDFTVRVPAGIRLAARTVNGDVRADALASHVEASTVNGSVAIATSGHAEAATVNGSVDVAMGSADWRGALRLATVNGEITLSLPAGADLVLEAKTLNGGIQSDFPAEMQRGRFVGRQASATLGRGGRRLLLETVNGAIRVRGAGDAARAGARPEGRTVAAPETVEILPAAERVRVEVSPPAPPPAPPRPPAPPPPPPSPPPAPRSTSLSETEIALERLVEQTVESTLRATGEALTEMKLNRMIAEITATATRQALGGTARALSDEAVQRDLSVAVEREVRDALRAEAQKRPHRPSRP
jgi:cytoskeletal protein CcmA (bactofilin family)